MYHRQFDLRSSDSSQANPKNVIVNLNAHLGHSAEAKCLAINPLRPEYLAVGANDPYIRMYDRRMLVFRSLKVPQETTNRYISTLIYKHVHTYVTIWKCLLNVVIITLNDLTGQHRLYPCKPFSF